MSLFSTFISRRPKAPSTSRRTNRHAFIQFFDPLGPLFAGLLVLVLALSAAVHLSGCGEILPLIPSATVVSVSPERVRPGEAFVVTTRVSPDVTACVMTAFGERIRCSVQTTICECEQSAPNSVGGVVVLRVNATTSNGIAEAKASLIVDGAPPAVDGSRVEVHRNEVGLSDAIEGAAGAVVDRPFTEVVGARIDVFETDALDAEKLAGGEVRPDGSFGPFVLEGTEDTAPSRVFVVVTDDLENQSAAIEIAGARDEVGPRLNPEGVSILRLPIGESDVVIVDETFAEKDDGCALHSLFVHRLDQDPLFDEPIAQVRLSDDEETRVAFGTPTESLPTGVATVTDKCGNRSFPTVVEIGADADVPTVDLRIIEAKVTSTNSVRVVGGPSAVFDDTSAIRELEIFVDGTLVETIVPQPDGSFATTLTVEHAEEIQSVSFLVVDKVGRRTVRIRVAALTLALPQTAFDVVVPTSLADAEQLSTAEAAIGAVPSDATELLSEEDGQMLYVVGAPASDGGFQELSPAVTPSGSPRERLFAAAAFDPVEEHLVLVGGVGEEGIAYADSWKFADATWSPIWDDPLVSPGNPSVVLPGPRYRAQMAYSSALGAIVLFGGEGEGDARVFLDDTWTFSDADGWQALNVFPAPPARSGASMFEDPSTGHLILFGGDCFAGPCDDVWEFDGLHWRPHDACASGPLPLGRSGAQVAVDPISGTIVLFGGRRSGLLLDDTWVFDGGWREVVSPFRPSARAGGALFFDPSLRLVVLHGGEGSADADARFWGVVDDSWAALNTAGTPPPQRAWGIALALPRPTIGFGIASNANFFFPQADLWQGQVQASSGAKARLGVRLERPSSAVASASVVIAGGGTSSAQDGYAVYAQDADGTFALAGLAASTNGSETFVLPSAAMTDETVVLLLESRGPTTTEVASTLSIDAIRVEWLIANEP